MRVVIPTSIYGDTAAMLEYIKSKGLEQLPNGAWVDQSGNVATITSEEELANDPEYVAQREAQSARETAQLSTRRTASQQSYNANQLAGGVAPNSLRSLINPRGAQAGSSRATIGLVPGGVKELISGDVDEYSKFKSEFKRMTGRDITQEDMNSNEYLGNLSNELIAALPIGRLTGMDTRILQKLPNELLFPIMQANPSLIAQMPINRLQTFDMNQIGSTIMPFLQQNMPEDAMNLGNAISNQSSTASPYKSPTADSNVGATWNPKTKGGTANELIRGGFDASNLSDDQMSYLFPFQEDPELASRNLMRGMGFNMEFSNPYNEFLSNRMPDLYQQNLLKQIITGGLTDTASLDRRGPDIALGGLTQQGGLGMGDFKTGYDRIRQKMGPDSDVSLLNPAERLFYGQLMGKGTEQNQLDVASNLSGLRGPYGRAANRANATMAERYRNQAGSQSGTLLDFLMRGR